LRPTSSGLTGRATAPTLGSVRVAVRALRAYRSSCPLRSLCLFLCVLCV